MLGIYGEQARIFFIEINVVIVFVVQVFITTDVSRNRLSTYKERKVYYALLGKVATGQCSSVLELLPCPLCSHFYPCYICSQYKWQHKFIAWCASFAWDKFWTWATKILPASGVPGGLKQAGLCYMAESLAIGVCIWGGPAGVARYGLWDPRRLLFLGRKRLFRGQGGIGSYLFQFIPLYRLLKNWGFLPQQAHLWCVIHARLVHAAQNVKCTHSIIPLPAHNILPTLARSQNARLYFSPFGEKEHRKLSSCGGGCGQALRCELPKMLLTMILESCIS